MEQHKTMFKRVNGEIIQCVIKPHHRDGFEAIGFVDNVSRLKPEEAKQERKQEERKTRDKSQLEL